jgi:hypothetical protein
MVISPQVAWSAVTTFIALQVSYCTAVWVGQAGPFCSLFFGMSLPHSLFSSSTPFCSPTFPSLFPLPFCEHKHNTKCAYTAVTVAADTVATRVIYVSDINAADFGTVGDVASETMAGARGE